ncbi:MAG: acyl-CoA thioesterase [Muribaculaceae bacterium]|nr:acyl-CoA thioesterase [Muribaculaceae bacterium]MDE6400167.1 acyl-CoA thioesterase [Muribaculaceae bacterium]MDE6532826.1 acyl-CoA thioesterase [Muribaculaceae bacterium]
MDYQNLPDISLFHDRTGVQIRFNDVDVLGHVNNTVYFAFYDTGKAHYFNSVGGKPVDWKHVDMVIANVNCSFMAPIVFGEDIEVLTTCLSVSNKSMRILQLIRETASGQIKSACETVMVCFDPATGQTSPVPEEWKKRACDFEGRDIIKHNTIQ